jgi:hypothetical protein
MEKVKTLRDLKKGDDVYIIIFQNDDTSMPVYVEKAFIDTINEYKTDTYFFIVFNKEMNCIRVKNNYIGGTFVLHTNEEDGYNTVETIYMIASEKRANELLKAMVNQKVTEYQKTIDDLKKLKF